VKKKFSGFSDFRHVKGDELLRRVKARWTRAVQLVHYTKTRDFLEFVVN